MGTLTSFLQREFVRHQPLGWECDVEVPVLPPALATVLGYSPRADVVLTNASTKSRLWVEFEVSRADPVANHAKFATAQLFRSQAPADHFVAMVSPHIDRGRRNLAAATIRLMRKVGMSAFQTTLFPLIAPAEIKRLNCTPNEVLMRTGLDVVTEIERVFATITPVGRWGRLDVHYVGDLLDLLVNLRGWNTDIESSEGRTAWGRRSISYFVHDPISKMFAPSKFCAYVPVLPRGGGMESPSADTFRMTTALYSHLNDGSHTMDGHKAWHHLTACLGMRSIPAIGTGSIAGHFARWHQKNSKIVAVPGGDPTILVPPTWYCTAPN
jgi:hypothetical protein